MRKLAASTLGVGLLLALSSCDTRGVTSNDIVQVGDVSYLVVSGDGQSGNPGTELPNALVVKAQDSKGKGIKDQIINFRVVLGGGTVFAGAAITNKDGIARERWTLGAGGPQRVEARAVDTETGDPITFGVFNATVIDVNAPAVSGVSAVPSPSVVGTPVALTANVSDAASGGSNIASAEYRADGGAWTAMTSADGAFNEPNEDVQATVSGLTVGTHQLCVRGRDAANNTSAESCVTATVLAGATLAIAPLSHDFGALNVGASASLIFAVTNVGASTTSLISVSITGGSGAFSLIGSTCGAPLAPGASCAVNVRFQPGAAGPTAGSLNASSPIGGSTSASLGGTGNAVYTLNVTSAGTGTGTVTSNPAGIACGPDCSETYNDGTVVNLTATPSGSSTFTGWSGACTGTGACSVTMDAAKSVTATFTSIQYQVTVARAGNGSGAVTSTPAGINCGADCTEPFNSGAIVVLSAAANPGSSFTGWSGGGCSGTGACVINLTAATTVTATFTLDLYALTVSRGGTGAGTVTSNPAGINCGADCSESYSAGTVVLLTAAPANGSTFTGWTGACTGSGSCVVTMDQAKSVTATFTANQYALTVGLSGTGTGQVTSSPFGILCGAQCSAGYDFNTAVILTPSPAAGSVFVGWSGACTGTGTCIVTMDAAKTVGATFNLVTYQLNVAKNGQGTVTSAPAGINCGADCSESYVSGTVVTLNASADAGWSFVGWSGGGCSGTGTCNVTVTAATTVTATFQQNSFTLTVLKGRTGTGTVTSSPAGINCGSTCSANYVGNTMVTLTAAPNPQNNFAGWSGGGCSGTGTCTVSMTGAVTVQATFTSAPFTLSVAKAGTGTGTVTSSPTGINCGADCSESYGSGVLVQLTAAPGSGSVFTGWSGGGCSGTGTCIVQMNSNVSVTATFAGPNLVVFSPAVPVQFGNVVLGGSSTLVITIGNSGLLTTGQINSVTVSDAQNYSILSNGCAGLSLAQGSSCNITVRFAPVSTGAKAALLNVQAANAPLLSVDLQGAGV